VARKKATAPVGIDQQIVDSIVKPEQRARLEDVTVNVAEPAQEPSDILTLMLAELKDDFMTVAAKLDICDALLKRLQTTTSAAEAAAVLTAIAYLWRVADRRAADALNVDKRERTRAMALLLSVG
jgi:hypothetical protein